MYYDAVGRQPAQDFYLIIIIKSGFHKGFPCNPVLCTENIGLFAFLINRIIRKQHC